MKPHRSTLWQGVIIPRSGVDPTRISKLLDYDSIIINSHESQKLWPRSDKKLDDLRKKLLKKAEKAGADPEDVKKLSQGLMATWP
jgi:hypothetical protein